MKVTAVLLKYKRIDELNEIIEHLKDYDFINQIIIHDNTVNNDMCWGRYIACEKAKNDIIYTQDDDCIVHNIKEIFDNYVSMGCNALINNLKTSHKDIKDYSLLGWGSMFDKSWLSCMKPYTDKHDKDYVFCREADIIFTGLLKKRMINLDANITDFPSATNEHAMYNQLNHNNMRQLAVKRINELK